MAHNPPKETYVYACPHGCKHQNKYPVASSIRGWKRHMSGTHKGWSEDEMQTAMNGVSPDANQRRLDYMAEAQKIVSGEKTADTSSDLRNSADPDSAAFAPDQATESTKRVQFKSKKLRKMLSSLPEVFLKAKGIEPDQDDRDLIDTATEMLEELFGIAFEVPDTQFVVRSRWLALLFPLGAMMLVWAKHSFAIGLKGEENAKTPEV